MTDWTYEDATHELLAVLPLLNRIVVGEVRREVGEDTTMAQYRVLTHLADGPQTLSSLSKKRHVSLQSMGEMIQTLVERGWVERIPNPNDRRQQLLHQTTEGRSHHERAQELLLARLTPLLTSLTAEELAAVRVALPALRRVLGGDQEDDSNGG